ncbi:MAG: hypothetical protein U1F43_22750 [Myxococcota bacterium]
MTDFDERLGPKARWFRDEAQRDRVRSIVRERVADDRRQDECRYLMRFWWHLIMPYREVSYDELREHLEPPALALIDALLAAIEAGHAAIDGWADRAESALAIVVDRGHLASTGSADGAPEGPDAGDEPA